MTHDDAGKYSGQAPGRHRLRPCRRRRPRGESAEDGRYPARPPTT